MKKKHSNNLTREQFLTQEQFNDLWKKVEMSQDKEFQYSLNKIIDFWNNKCEVFDRYVFICFAEHKLKELNKKS